MKIYFNWFQGKSNERIRELLNNKQNQNKQTNWQASNQLR